MSNTCARLSVAFLLLSSAWACSDDPAPTEDTSQDDLLPAPPDMPVAASCAAETDNCDARATCTDTDAGFLCECPSGFEGDGTTCTLPSGAVVGDVGAEGGTITTEGGETLEVPMGSVDEETPIVVRTGVAAPAAPPEWLIQLGDAIELDPAGATFDPPLQLTVRYEQGELPEGGLEERLTGLHYIDADGEVEEAVRLAQDLEANELTVAIPHFSFLIRTRIAIRLVSAGIVTNPVVVNAVNDAVVRVFESLPDDDAREQFLADNAALLGPYLEAAESVLGEDPLGEVTLPEYQVAVSVSGLLGSGLTLQNNAGDELTISSDGEFVFSETLTTSESYAVTVGAQPSGPSQTCTVFEGSGSIMSADVTISVTCVTNTFTVGGTVSGLAGSGLVLQNNGGDDLAIADNGAFTFSTALADGSEYAVTVLTQPSSPVQTCTVSQGAGTLAGAAANAVSITCSTNTFSIGGTVSGLAGTGLVLQNNGGDDLAIADNGAFTFSTALADGSEYAVTVRTQPSSPSQTCEITDGTGALAGEAVGAVSVTCVTNTFTVGGTVSGLAGTGLVLQNNGGDDLAIADNGAFTFPTSLADGSEYVVTVLTQPTGLSQTCTVSQGSGNVAAENVTRVDIDCQTDGFVVSASVSGLAGTGLVLQNNAADDLAVTENGTFEFVTEVIDGQDYDVTVVSQPSAPQQTCAVTSGAGTIAGEPVSVDVGCTTDLVTVGGTVSGLTGAGLELDLNGTEQLAIDSGGEFTFGAVASGSSYAVTVSVQPSGQLCSVSNGTGTLDGPVTDVAVSCVDFVLSGSAGARGVLLTWPDLGADRYDVVYSTDEACALTDITSCADGVEVLDVTSTYALTGLSQGEIYFIGLRASVGGATLGVARTVQRVSPVVANNSVEAIEVVADGTVYLGGNFTSVGPATGGGVRLRTGERAVPRGFPEVAGTVFATASDGAGGFYIGGFFTSVAGTARNNLAHVLADGSVGSWDPNANNTVRALAVDGGTVYAGGDFTNVGEQTRNRLAALDASTGSVVTDWNPSANGTVWALAVDGSTVYAGGNFTSVGGQTRNRLAALDASTGALDDDWDPDANNRVYALAVDDGTVYAGGDFTRVGGDIRNHVAALDASTGALGDDWDPDANNRVYALAVDDGTVYAGGQFTSIGGQTRNRLAALDASTGAATAWDPNANNLVWVLAVDDGTVYAGGGFTSVGEQFRNRLAALDTSTGTATAWDPDANSIVYALAVDDGTVYAGGGFSSVGGQTRNRLAALDASTGAVTDWDPDANSTVRALAVDDGTVYAGGNFTSVGGQTRSRLAALDASTGVATAWDPNANNAVLALAVDGGTVYAAGFFTSVGGLARNNLAALDASTGAATAWNPSANSSVYALAVDDGTVYAGGDFTRVGGDIRNHVAALEASTGAATAWDPNANNAVYALAVDGGTVYAGGFFTSIGGQTRNRLAALDASTGAVAAWDPDANNAVVALAVDGGTVYVGGSFSSVGGQARNRLAALDASTGAVAAWDPDANSSVVALAVDGGTVYVGGSFSSVGGQARRSFAAIDRTTGVVE